MKVFAYSAPSQKNGGYYSLIPSIKGVSMLITCMRIESLLTITWAGSYGSRGNPVACGNEGTGKKPATSFHDS